jgi:hypothetical protein
MELDDYLTGTWPDFMWPSTSSNLEYTQMRGFVVGDYRQSAELLHKRCPKPLTHTGYSALIGHNVPHAVLA